MRLGRTRLALACVIGSITVGLAAPAAWATNDTDAANTMPAATATAGALASAGPDAVDTATQVPTPPAGSVGSATPAVPPQGQDALPSQPPVTKRPGGVSLPSGLPSLPGMPLTDLDKRLVDLAPWLPDDVSLADLVPQPLVVSFTCGPKGPAWTLKNTAAKAYGFAWIDTNVNYNFGAIGAGKTISLDSSADAVIAGAVDVETGDVVLAIPAFAIAHCATTTTASPTPTSTSGSGGGGTVPVSTTTAPVAAPATAVVTDKVHYTG